MRTDDRCVFQGTLTDSLTFQNKFVKVSFGTRGGTLIGSVKPAFPGPVTIGGQRGGFTFTRTHRDVSTPRQGACRPGVHVNLDATVGAVLKCYQIRIGGTFLQRRKHT